MIHINNSKHGCLYKNNTVVCIKVYKLIIKNGNNAITNINNKHNNSLLCLL